MAFDKADIRSLVDAALGSHGTPDRTGGINDVDMNRLIDDAVVYYSRLSPEAAVHDISGTGSDYDFALPSDWEETFSSLLGVEYPYGERVPTMLALDQVTIYLSDSGYVFRMLYNTPASGATVRLIYTRPRVVADDSGDTTVPDADKEAIGHLTSHLAALRLAAEMAKVVRSSLNEDPLNLRASVIEYERIARRQWELFADHMGIPAEGSKVPAISHSVEHVNKMSWGQPPFSHGENTQRIFRR